MTTPRTRGEVVDRIAELERKVALLEQAVNSTLTAQRLILDMVQELRGGDTTQAL